MEIHATSSSKACRIHAGLSIQSWLGAAGSLDYPPEAQRICPDTTPSYPWIPSDGSAGNRQPVVQRLSRVTNRPAYSFRRDFALLRVPGVSGVVSVPYLVGRNTLQLVPSQKSFQDGRHMDRRQRLGICSVTSQTGSVTVGSTNYVELIKFKDPHVAQYANP